MTTSKKALNSSTPSLTVVSSTTKKAKVTLDIAQGIHNILAVYERTPVATREIALHWYKEANQFTQDVAKEFNVTALRVAAVTAALSPRNVWPRNTKDAKAVFQACAAGLGFDSIKVCTFNGNKTKAFALATTTHLDEYDALAILSGEKTSNFFLNIYDPSRAGVTVDGHAFNIFMGVYKPLDQTKAPSKANYQLIANAYTLAGSMVGVSPSELQAITWLQWRLENGIVDSASNSL